MRTNNKTRMSSNLIMADRTFFGSVSRIDIDNSTIFPYSFVFNKALQLPKCPLMHPFVISCGSSNIAQIFHYYSASIRNTINDSLTYIMVSPCHKPRPISRELSQMSLSGFGAFSLEFANQVIVLDSEKFNLLPEEHLGRCYSEIVYADINSKNLILEVRVIGIDIFSECEQEEASAFCVNPQQAFSNIPTEVFFVTVRDTEWNLNPAFDSGQAQDVVLERCRARKIISHRTSGYNWLIFSLLDHSTGLLDTSNSELRWQSLPELLIDEGMELNIISYLSSPSSINTELQGFSVRFDSSNYLSSCGNLNFSCCSDFHSNGKEDPIFKTFGGGIPLHPNCFAVQDVVSCQL